METMIVYWPWGVIITSAVTVTIWMNGHHWRSGWLVGAGSQLAQIGFGAMVLDVWTFWFATAPMLMFAWNWWQHPKREAELRRRYGGAPVDVPGQDQLIIMSRGVLDHLKTPPLPAVPPVPLPPMVDMRAAVDDQLRLLGDAFKAWGPAAPLDMRASVDRAYDVLAGKDPDGTIDKPGDRRG